MSSSSQRSSRSGTSSSSFTTATSSSSSPGSNGNNISTTSSLTQPHGVGMTTGVGLVTETGRILTGKYLEKASSKKDLVLRLRKILYLLREDDSIEPDSDECPGLAALCSSLTQYVNHRDKDVRLYTVAACMELFTVYAPEAPWSELETIDIFKQTIRQLANLAHSGQQSNNNNNNKDSPELTQGTTTSGNNGGGGPHFYQYYRILELLAEVKIAVVLVDLSKKNDDDISCDDGDDDDDDASSLSHDDDSDIDDDDDDDDDLNVNVNKNNKKRKSNSSQRQRNTTIANKKTTTTTITRKKSKKNKENNNINYEALQVLTELFRTLLQSVRNEHPTEIFDFCQKTLTSCVEEFFETTILPVPILDEILVCIGQGPRVLVLQHQNKKQQQQQATANAIQQDNNKKGRKGRSKKATASTTTTSTPTAAVAYVQQNNPSYMVASAVVRASVERLSTPIASLLNGLVNSDPRSIEKSTISNHVCESNDDDDDNNNNKSKKDGDNNVSDMVLEMSSNIGIPQRQQQDVHAMSNVYCVILELQRVAPAILTTVIGNLASHVETLDADHRCLVVQTLGKLFAGTGSGGAAAAGSSKNASIANLTVAYEYNPCFRSWLARSGDRIEDIRQIMLPHIIALTEAGSRLLRNDQLSTSPQAELAREVQDALIVRLTNDPSKTLSLQIIQELCTISYNHRKALSRNLMDHVGLKVLSKVHLERKNALTGLVQLFFRQYIRFHLSTVQDGGDDCPIENVIQVFNNCCRPNSKYNGAGATTTTTSLIAARCKASSSSMLLSPKRTPKKKKSTGRGRSRRQARSTIVSEEDDDDDYDEDESMRGNRINRLNEYGGGDDDDNDFSYYQWIPCVLFESTSYTDVVDSEMRSRVVQLMDELLLGSSSPHPDNRRHLTSTARATGLAVVVDAVRNQSPSAWNGMVILQSERAKLQKTLRAYLDARADIRNHETGSEEHFVADAKAKDLLEKVSSMIPPPSGAAPAHGKLHAVLEKFHSMKDKHIFRIISSITNPSHSIKARARALDDLPKRVKSTAGDAVQTWVKSLAKRCAMGDLINHDIIHHCVLLAQECLRGGEFEAAHKFLVCVQLAADSFPSLCAEEEVFDNLTEIFQECNSMISSSSSSSSHQKNEIDQSTIMTILSAILASVSPYRSSSGNDTPNLLEDDFHKKLVTLCRDGTPEQARHAVATMAALSMPKDGMALTQEQTDTSLSLLKTLATPSRLAIASTGPSTKLVCVLVALAELADHAPTVFESSSRGTNALKFALEKVLMGRAHSTAKNHDDDDDNGSSSSDDETEIEETKTPKRGKNGRKSNNVSSHLSPTTADTSLVEDDNLSISCRTLCAAMELLATFIRSSVFTAKKMKTVLPKESIVLIGKVFDILSQILRDQGMPPSSRDRKMCSLRQDLAALRQCAAIHLFRLCDTRLGLDQKYLTTEKWGFLASSLLDDECVVRKAVMEELGLMLTGHGKYATKLGMGMPMAPRLRFVAMSVLCIDGSHGSHSRGNGNAANIGKFVKNQKGNVNGSIEHLRNIYESSAAQYRAQGPQAEKQFEARIKATVMPEYAVPYAFHLLSYRHETPSNTGLGSSKNKDDEEFEIDEGGQKVLKKRLKAIYDPLVLQLGASADNISFLLRMAELLAKSYQPIGFSSAGSRSSDDGKKERNKLTNICATAREVLLSYVKTDSNLDTHPGAILIPGNLFRKLENRKRSVNTLSSSTAGSSPILYAMMQNEDSSELGKRKNSSRKALRRSTDKSIHDTNDKMRPIKHHNDTPTSSTNHDEEFGTNSNDEMYENDTLDPAPEGKKAPTEDMTQKKHYNNMQEDDTSDSRKATRRSTRSIKHDEDSDSKMSSTDSRKALRRSTRSRKDSDLNIAGSNEDDYDLAENGTKTSESSQSIVTHNRDDASTLENGTDNKVGKRKSSIRPETPKGSVADSRVHFSPEVEVDFDFGVSPIMGRRSSSRNSGSRSLMSSAEAKTRGTNPPSDLRFTATASLALGASPDTTTSPTPVSASMTSKSSDRKVNQPLGDKRKAVHSQSRSKRVTKKLAAVDDKENPKKKPRKQIPNQIKIVRSTKVKANVSKTKKIRPTRKRNIKKSTKATVDTFDFDG